MAGFNVRGDAKNWEKFGSCANAVLASVPYIVTVKSSLFITEKYGDENYNNCQKFSNKIAEIKGYSCL
jgi:hypothetical protein